MENNVRVIPNDIFFEHVMDLLGEGQSVTINVSGRSMSPTFRDRVDKLVISPFRPEDLKVGDVVLFDRGDAICVHRIIERNGDRLVIRGDGNSRKALERVKVSAVMGLITGGTMFGGREFSVEDDIWKRNTVRVLRYFPVLSAIHYVLRIVRSYPLSILTSLLLLYLSFFKPSENMVPSFENADKLAHFLMYSGTSLVFWFEWLRLHLHSGREVLRGFIFCFLVPIAIGGAIELIQEYIVEYRGGEWLDLAVDAIGVCAATLFSFAVVLPLLRRKKERNAK